MIFIQLLWQHLKAVFKTLFQMTAMLATYIVFTPQSMRFHVENFLKGK